MNDVLRSQQEEEQEGEVGRSMADKLDEGFADEEADSTLWCHQVAYGEQGEEQADEDTRDELASPVASPPAWELIVPA